MINTSHQCGTEFVQLNGRTLRNALKRNRIDHEFGKFSNTEWVNVCPKCDAISLKGSPANLPFLCFDGVMRTVEDLACRPVSLDFCGFRFTSSALYCAIALVQFDDSTTKEVERLGLGLKSNLNSELALNFSMEVCKWGRGQRVLANLVRRNNGETSLGGILNDWFAIVDRVGDERAILLGTEINGLGVSFASKHLRMISPDRFAVLDEVLSMGLGFALNPKGYLFFLRSLRQFQSELRERHCLDLNIATLESGIFSLVRQQVRAQ